MKSEQQGVDPTMPGKGHRILLLATYPASLFIPPVQVGLEACGAEVYSAGPYWNSGMDLSKYNQFFNSYKHDVICSSDVEIEQLIKQCPAQPTSILYFEPPSSFLPTGLEHVEIPTVFVITEDRLHADYHGPLIPMFDRLLSAFGPPTEIHRGRGMDHAFNWYYAAVPEFLYDKKRPREVDVAFLGSLQPVVQRSRNNVIEELLELRREDISMLVGHGAFLGDYNDRLNEAKIVVHDSITRQLNMRVIEAMAAGCLVIAARPQSLKDYGAEQLLEGRHIVYFDDTNHAKELIRHYLNHAEEREGIAAAGQRQALKVFSSENVARELLVNHINQIPHDHLQLRRRRIQEGDYSIREATVRYFVQSGDPVATHHNAAAPSTRRLQNDLAVGDANLQRFRDSILRLETVLNDHPDMAVARANLVAIRHSTESSGNWARHAAWIEEQLAEILSASPQQLEPADLESAYYPLEYNRFRMETAGAFQDATGSRRAQRLLELQIYKTRLYAADAHMKAKNFAAAERQFRAALTVVPDDGYTMAKLAAALIQQLQFDEATELLVQAVELEPFYADAQLSAAKMLVAERKLKQAAEMFGRILDNPCASEQLRQTAAQVIGRLQVSGIARPVPAIG